MPRLNLTDLLEKLRRAKQAIDLLSRICEKSNLNLFTQRTAYGLREWVGQGYNPAISTHTMSLGDLVHDLERAQEADSLLLSIWIDPAVMDKPEGKSALPENLQAELRAYMRTDGE